MALAMDIFRFRNTSFLQPDSSNRKEMFVLNSIVFVNIMIYR